MTTSSGAGERRPPSGEPAVVVSVACPRCPRPARAQPPSCPLCSGSGRLLLRVAPADAALPADELLVRYAPPDADTSA